MGLKAILFTGDPYEPRGLVGIYETEEQRKEIIAAYLKKSHAQWKGASAFSDEYHLSCLSEDNVKIGFYTGWY